MERLNENAKYSRREIGVGFIKSRKADHKVMDYCERMIEEAEKEGCEIFFVDVDRNGSRDIDRPELDAIYEAMKLGSVSHLFIRSLSDITDDMADLMEFKRKARENLIKIHIVLVEPYSDSKPDDVWDGGAGC